MRSLFHTIMGKGAPAPSYPASLKLFIDAGNVASYPGSGTVVTDLIGNQNGTLTGGTGWSSSNGGYFTFDNVNDTIEFPINTTVQSLTSRTVSMWVNFATREGVFFSDINLATVRNGLLNLTDSLGVQRGFFCSSSSAQFGDNALTDLNTWYYTTLRFNGTTFSILKNGIEVYTVAQSGTMSTQGAGITIGNCNPTLYPLDGKISQMKIYNEYRSDADVLTDFNEFKARYGY